MARIRSIKPEFWIDGKTRRLSDSCALFFISLWNFCDDEGKCLNDSFELASKTSRFKSQHISKWVQTLFESGLIQVSTDFRWISIANWNHQKIDKPRSPEVKKSEIEWLPLVTPDLSTNAIRMFADSSATPRRKDRIGEDRKGKDRIIGEASPRSPKALAPIGKNLTAHYCEEYQSRYQTNPVIRPQDGKLLKTLGESLGELKAKEIITAYLRMNNSWFITKSHDVTTLNQNLNQVQNFLTNGLTVTRADAQNAETKDSLSNQINRLTRGD